MAALEAAIHHLNFLMGGRVKPGRDKQDSYSQPETILLFQYCASELVCREGLHKELRVVRNTLMRPCITRVSADHENRECGPLLPGQPDQLRAGHVGKSEIGDKQIDTLI